MTKRDNSTFAIAINDVAVIDSFTMFYAPGAPFDQRRLWPPKLKNRVVAHL